MFPMLVFNAFEILGYCIRRCVSVYSYLICLEEGGGVLVQRSISFATIDLRKPTNKRYCYQWFLKVLYV